MVNEKINKRIAVTLPQRLLTRLNEYCVKNSYVRVSDVIRLALEKFLAEDFE